MSAQTWERPFAAPNETTAEGERKRAERRAKNAEEGMCRTQEVVSGVRALVGYAKELHEEDHYVQHLLPILRGTRHVS